MWRGVAENEYDLAMFSVCEFLGVSEVRRQAEKLIERGFGDLVAQSAVRLPGGSLQRNVWMIHPASSVDVLVLNHLPPSRLAVASAPHDLMMRPALCRRSLSFLRHASSSRTGAIAAR